MRNHPRLVVAALGAVLASCSSAALADYPSATSGAVRAMEAGRFQEAAEWFRDLPGADDENAFLAHAESGMAWHVGGRLEAAVREWLAAGEVLASYEDRPTISGRSVVEGTLSFFVNDQTIPYDGEGFEVVLLHGFLAWDYLRLGSLDDALVEVRRGYDLERFEEDRYGTKYGMNRFARFVAAVAQELDGRPDEARIDLERLAKEVGAEHPVVKASLERLAKADTPEGREELAAQSELIVVHERGRMPAKRSEEFVYQTRRSLGKLAVPAFDAPPPAPPRLVVRLDGDEVGRTTRLENVENVARRNLADRIAWVTAKAMARSALKTVVVDQAAEEASDQHGEWAGVLVGVVGSLWNLASERADLRSWRTLPREIQVLRVPVEPGEHRVVLTTPGGGRVDLGPIDFQARRPVFVSARTLGGRIWAAPPRAVRGAETATILEP